jgi:hypothetical protein
MGDEEQGPDVNATFTANEIEKILADFVAAKAGMKPPYVRACKWLWNGQPTAHVSLTQAPPQLVCLPSRSGENRR